MSDLHPPARGRTRLIVIAVAAAIIAALAAVGITGLIIGPPTDPGPTSAPTSTAPATPDGEDNPAKVRLPVTNDPVRYATAVAEVLFAWDAVDGLNPDAYRSQLHTAATAEGEESNGLYHDIGNYLPDPDAWTQLVQMQARQWLEVTTAAVPDGWAEVADHEWAGAHSVAVTIDGTRHREGVWAGRPTDSASPVAFTLFLSCPPGDGCKLLRLTLPDAPLR